MEHTKANDIKKFVYEITLEYRVIKNPGLLPDGEMKVWSRTPTGHDTFWGYKWAKQFLEACVERHGKEFLEMEFENSATQRFMGKGPHDISAIINAMGGPKKYEVYRAYRDVCAEKGIVIEGRFEGIKRGTFDGGLCPRQLILHW